MTKLQKTIIIGSILIGGYYIYKQKNCRLKKLGALINCSSDGILCEQQFFDTKNNKVVIRDVWVNYQPIKDEGAWHDGTYYLDKQLTKELEALYQAKQIC